MYSLKTLMICSGLCFFTGVFIGLLLAVLALASPEYLDEQQQKKKEGKNGGSKRL